MVLQGRAREPDRTLEFSGRRVAEVFLSQDGFSGIEDDADEALEISQAQLLHKSRRKEPPPPPSSLKTKKKPPQCQNEIPKETEAVLGTEAVTDAGGEDKVNSSDSDSSSSEDEER